MGKRNYLFEIIKFYRLNNESKDIDIKSAVIDYDFGQGTGWSEVRINNAFKAIKFILNDNK